MSVKAVLFDCDGVLVDSEALSVSALLGMIELAGGTVSEDAAYEHFLGKSMKSVREILGRDFGLEISDQHLTAMRVNLMRKFREELKPIPGVKEVAAWVSPVPGGVGPMTRVMLLDNVVQMAEQAVRSR